MIPGFDDPALAARPPGGNLYYEGDAGVSSKLVGERPGRGGHGQQVDVGHADLMFGSPMTHTGDGEEIVPAAAQTGGRGHFTEVLNFHGSPAPWILIGLLLVVGFLHLEASGKVEL
jgi:hypothetical protein